LLAANQEDYFPFKLLHNQHCGLMAIHNSEKFIKKEKGLLIETY